MQAPPPLSRPKRTEIRKLALRKHREESGRFLAEGLRTVEQLLTHGLIQVETVVLDASRPVPPLPPCEMRTVEPDDFRSLSTTESDQGVIAVCRIPDATPMADLLARRTGPLLWLDALQDPGNLGTVYRSAAWFGAVGIGLGTGTVDLFHPKTVRSTAGATGALPYATGIISEWAEAARRIGRPLFRLDAGPVSVSLSDITIPADAIWVLGNEGNGLSEAVRALPATDVRIPGNAHLVESLNAAVAASIALSRNPNVNP